MLQVPDDGLTNKQRRNKVRNTMRREAAKAAAALADATHSPVTEAGSGPEHVLTGGSWDTPSRALLLGCLLSIHTRGMGE
jgi:hypothetical protein